MAASPPRVLIVSRRCVRKNKFVDYVGEYHLDLILRYGAVPIIVPRVSGIEALLDTFEPFHGLLLVEGEDIHPSLYQHNKSNDTTLTANQLDDIRRHHPSDTAVDQEKDSIELRLVNLCLRRNIPCMGICRGSQMLNVACGGTLYQDVESKLGGVVHMDYQNYDGHRHPVRVVAGTPMERWFEETRVLVSSYHHQGVKRLAERFVGMAYSEDGLVEGFYDPEEGRFVVGLQFHPERMRRSVQGCEGFDYPGCAKPYEEFVKATIAYQKKLNSSYSKLDSRIMGQQKDSKSKLLLKSFSIPKNLFDGNYGSPLPRQSNDLGYADEFLESYTRWSIQQEKILKQMGATVRNGSLYIHKLKMNKEKEKVARNVIGKMSMEQLPELLSFYNNMSQICNEVLEMKLQTN